ncbi:MAG: DUF3300 domain-containing protein [Betaproteobacteria bacterium]|jgi:hypothetical protein|nr:DUF3300 domain-containing protein [Betaproteobacteria bacterium]
MLTPTSLIYKRALTWVAALLTSALLAVAHGSAAAQSQSAYTQPELDRMLAPIALYPDPLLSQILMAATYPIEVVEAARWSRANPSLRDDDAVRKVEEKDWDPSVKSLVAFPNVLARMDENLDWTRDLGDAFLAQEPQVMDTVQKLRQRARAAGTLASDARIRVLDEGRTIVVQPVDPRVVYVPYYDPRLAYGTWWWPAYPPVVWAPWPGYAVHYPPPRPGVAVGFFWGPAVRISVGFFFGAIDWPHREVRVVNVTNYYYRPVIVRRDAQHVTPAYVAPGPWRHDPWHRRGATYRTPDVVRRLAPAPPHEAHRAVEHRPDPAPARPEPRAVRTDPAKQVTREAPRRDEHAQVRKDGSSQSGRTVLRQPAAAAPHVVATPPAAPRAAPRVATKAPAAQEARREPPAASGRQDKRTAAHAPAARAQPRREAESERARPEPGKPAEGQVVQPSRSRGDDRG